MKIALLTEGVSEYKALPALYDQIHARTMHRLMPPLRVAVTPDAPAAVVARECKSRLIIASARGAGMAIVLLDREQQSECPGLLASAIEAAVGRTCTAVPTRVVLKNRTFENWLVADLAALTVQPRRFKVTATMRNQVEPNKADGCEATKMIKSAIVSGQYDKVHDAERVCGRMNLVTAASHSRSLRHFLHVVSDSVYVNQCRKPS